MLSLAFLALMAGGVSVIAGITGSSFSSVVQGKPDKAKAKTLESAAGSTESTSPTAFPTISGGKVKFGSVLQFAKSELGQPYVWGGSEPGGFDCSGLVQYVYDKAGIRLPRVAQEQYNATRHISPSESLLPGYLVFFGQSPTEVTHVGIYLGAGKMLDAPHTGAQVRVEPIPTQIGAAWGEDRVIGFTEP